MYTSGLDFWDFFMVTAAVSVLLSSNAALICGNSTTDGPSYYALIKAVLAC